ncbi:SH3 domain-containing protein [Clostridium perfringens]|uniref:SH3 domain-containing protein n=1 Tax=Clostridium perfringens TaxID=1502 RepID=UPI0011201634|nr:SH3 domain-containing protein [Clostridium perfringens]TPE20281.1 SH3 domain-containing protein [Clostridium perfringens]
MKRKKLSIFILSAVIVTSSISYGISAKADELKEVKGYNQNINASTQKGVANNKVSVKKVNGEILGYANPFTMLQILNTNESTVEVITQNGLRGYLNADEFTLVESAINDKLIEKNMEGHVTNVSTVLNLRKEPRIGSEIINRLINNTKVNIIGKQGSWYKIEVNGQKGYVYGMFLNEGTIKDKNSDIVSNKKSEVKSEDKKEKKSSVKTDVKKETKNEAKKEPVSGAKAKVAQKSSEEAKVKINEEVKPVINKEEKLKNNAEVKSEAKAEMKNEVKTEINKEVKAETNSVVSSETIQPVNTERKSENNFQVRPEMNTGIKSEETEIVSKENLETIQKKISEEKPETNLEMNSEVNDKEVSEIITETKIEEKKEFKPEESEDLKAEEKSEIKLDDKVEEKSENKPEIKLEVKAEDVLQSEEYIYLRMSISYGERLVDRNDIYTKESLKVLRTELEKAKKVFKDSQNLTMKLVEDTRYDLDKAIIDLVKLSDVKKPVKPKTNVKVKNETNPEKNQEVKAEEAKTAPESKVEEKSVAKPEVKVEEKQEVKSETASEEKVESKKEAKEQTDNVEVIVPEVKAQEDKEIKEDDSVKTKEEVKSEVAPEKKSREEEIEEILKSEEYRFLLMDIAYGERLADKFTVYTRDSIKRLNIAIEKAHRVVSKPEKLTKKLVEDTRDDVDRAIVDLVKRNN